MAKDSIDWVDNAKGLGILLVAIGHIYSNRVAAHVFLFHMPFFFLLSGFLYSPKEDRQQYLRDKSLHLLVPYFFFLLLIYLSFVVYRTLHQGFSAELLLPVVLGGRLLSGPAGVFWFVTCLFIVQQVMNWLITRYSTARVAQIMAGSLALAYVNSLVFPEAWLAWNANVALAACPFFFLGHLARKHAFDFRRWLPLACVIGLAALVAHGYWPALSFDMKFSDYGIPVVSVAIALALSLVVVELAKLSRRQIVLSRTLSTLGQASMVIMFLHQPIQMVLVKLPALANDTLRLLITLAITVVIYHLASLHVYGRALLLGAAADFRKIIHRDAARAAPSRAG